MPGLPKIQAIIPTAGIGKRLKSRTPKPFLRINHKPIFIYTLEVFEKCPWVDSIILVVHREYQKFYTKLVKKYKLKKIKHIINGGKTRAESVYRGVTLLDEDTHTVIVHDGVRPLVTQALVKASLKGSLAYPALVTALAVKLTIKEVDKDLFVRRTLNRRRLWEIQTPQVFKKDLLKKAYRLKNWRGATDEAVLVEELGAKVKVIKGDYRNIKITTREDLLIAKGFLK